MIYTEATMRFFDRNLLEGAQSFDAVGPDYLYTGTAALYLCWSLCSGMLLKSHTDVIVALLVDYRRPM